MPMPEVIDPEIKWRQRLQVFLDQLLKPVIPDENKRRKYLDSEPMKIWEQAFTHETYSPSFNYEELEFFGDAILKAVFPKYLLDNYPELTKNFYTELNREYMSKMFQAKFSKDMGLPQFIRVLGIEKANLNIVADVFEAFIGALVKIADQYIYQGIGFVVCYNMIEHLFKSVNIDIEKGVGAVKTQVNQIFSRFDLSDPSVEVDDPTATKTIVTVTLDKTALCSLGNIDDILAEVSETTDAKKKAYSDAIKTLSDYGVLNITTQQTKPPQRDDNNVTYKVILKQKQLDFLQTYGIKIKDPVIGKGVAFTKKEAEYEAYTNALNTLGNHGVTTKWATDVKSKRDFSDPEIAKYVPAATARLQAEGYVSMQFFISSKTTTWKGVIIQLVGIKPNGTREILSFVYTTDRSNYRAAKVGIIRHYANGYSRDTAVALPDHLSPYATESQSIMQQKQYSAYKTDATTRSDIRQQHVTPVTRSYIAPKQTGSTTRQNFYEPRQPPKITTPYTPTLPPQTPLQDQRKTFTPTTPATTRRSAIPTSSLVQRASTVVPQKSPPVLQRPKSQQAPQTTPQ
jgi:dsRNA-specific ribonuclease